MQPSGMGGVEMTRLILIRHGQTAWNEGAGEERFRGRTDLALDDTGQAQARAVARRLQHQEIAALYTSPLFRARQTIAPLAAALGLPAHPHEGLIDIDYGCFQGLTHSEAAATYPEIYTQWRTRPSQVGFPEGESLRDIQVRLLHLLGESLERHSGQTVVLLGHQIVNKVMACTLLGLDLDQIWRIQQDTCGIDLFAHVNDVWQILTLNDTCHLEALVVAA
jgi:probable phosphoglycerate mutase